MKKALLLFLCCLSVASLNSQPNLFGTTSAGGSNGGGTIFNFRPASTSLSIAKNFDTPAELRPSGLVLGVDGKLYGTTDLGGVDNFGTIFSIDPSGSGYKNLKVFREGEDGIAQQGILTRSNSNSLLFGATAGNGIFSFNTSNSTYKVIKTLNQETEGLFPNPGFAQASNGTLYGTTSSGGSANAGVIFSMSPSGANYTVLKTFDFNGDGANPVGPIARSSNGIIFGMTSLGGSENGGVLYSFNPATSIYTVLLQFESATSGTNPNGGLIISNSGILYGTASFGGAYGWGTLFSYNTITNSFSVLKNFDINSDGGLPSGRLLLSPEGIIYGPSASSGGSGQIYSFNTLSENYSIVKILNGRSEGSSPGGPLVLIGNKLIGNGALAGVADGGVIYSVDKNTSAFALLRSFGANTTGNAPQGTVIRGIDGKLYGMTNLGGGGGQGVIFSFNPTNSKYSVLKNFDGINGGYPNGSLLQAKDGKLYGVTRTGGVNGVGVMFSYDIVTATYSVLEEFNFVNGGNPEGNLIQANDGIIYGMAPFGGNNFQGLIFSFNPASPGPTSIAKSFDGNLEGGSPSGGLVQANNGKLYGMNQSGGSGLGVIFSFDPSDPNVPFQTLKNLEFGSEGYRPYGNFFQANDSKLYGLTLLGGQGNGGTLFSYDTQSLSTTILKSFDLGLDGGWGYGSVTQASDGKLYGMTAKGGTGEKGVIFSFDPATQIFTKLKDFVGSNGARPGQNCGFVDVSCKPTIICPANKTVFATDGNCSAQLDPGSPIIMGKCGIVSVTGTREDGKALNESYPVGTTRINWKVTDALGKASECQQKITVQDNQPPVINTSANSFVLTLPANHNYQTVNISQCVISVTDNCSSIPVSNVVITKVTSDEAEDAAGSADGNTQKDIKIANNCKSVDLRRERKDGGNGRVYTLYFSTKDESGKMGAASYKIFMPVDNSLNAIDNGVAYSEKGSCNDQSKSTADLETGSSDAGQLNLELAAQLLPNPTDRNFNLVIKGSGQAPVQVKIFDVAGRLISQLKSAPFNEITFGEKLFPGIYIVDLRQGNNKLTLKAVKK